MKVLHKDIHNCQSHFDKKKFPSVGGPQEAVTVLNSVHSISLNVLVGLLLCERYVLLLESVL
jgi:hypothetical protein